MTIKFPQQKVLHRRKEPRLSMIDEDPFFGVPGKILTFDEAMDLCLKVDNWFDCLDVESEIDYWEQIGVLTHEKAAKARSMKREIANEYRRLQDKDGRWTDMLMSAMNWVIGR